MSTAAELGWWGVLIAVAGGAIRVSTPYLFVSLGETLTEKSGRVNLGLEGTLVMGAMSGYGVAYLTGSPWLGVLVAGGAGALIGLVHGLVCNLPRVNDIAVGIALFLLGTGLAFSLGKPFIEPTAPRLPHLALGAWSDLAVIVRAGALQAQGQGEAARTALAPVQQRIAANAPPQYIYRADKSAWFSVHELPASQRRVMELLVK